jgi:hypothetical protein
MLNNILQQVPLFARLKDDELRCMQQGEELWLSPGEEFITEGKPAENFSMRYVTLILRPKPSYHLELHKIFLYVSLTSLDRLLLESEICYYYLASL